MPVSAIARAVRRGPALLCICAFLLGGLAGCSLFGGGSSASTTTVVVTVGGGGGPAPSGTATGGSGAGAGSGSAGAATPTPTAAPLRPAGPVIDGTQGSTTSFATPSGNIVCGAFRSDRGGWALRCDVLQHTWALPPRPASCEFDWSHGTYLEGGKAGLTCTSDTVAGSDLVGLEGTWWNGRPGSQVVTVERGKVVALAYGASMTFGSISCLSQTDGLHCTDSASGAGFDISREAYRLR